VGCVYVFFFSSRRRHTRFSRDWSSDVCSSDLGTPSASTVMSAGAKPRCSRVSRISSTSLRGACSQSEGCWFTNSETPTSSARCRSEERRVGKEGRSRWQPDEQENTQEDDEERR